MSGRSALPMRVSASVGNLRRQARSSFFAARGGEGEEQLEVFAIAERLFERAAGGARDGGFVELEAAAAGGGEAREVGGEAVAEVHHRVDAVRARRASGLRRGAG